MFHSKTISRAAGLGIAITSLRRWLSQSVQVRTLVLSSGRKPTFPEYLTCLFSDAKAKFPWHVTCLLPGKRRCARSGDESFAAGSGLRVPPIAQGAGVHRHGTAHARPRHRRQLGDLHPGQCHPAAQPARNRSQNSHPHWRQRRLLRQRRLERRRGLFAVCHRHLLHVQEESAGV